MISKLKASRKQVGFLPEWMTFEVHEACARIGGNDVVKKEITVLRLAEAIATGQAESSVFERADTCNSKYWYGWTDKKNGKRHIGWRNQPTIKRALEVATARARWWMRVKQGRAVENALDVLTDSVEAVAGQLVRIAVQGRASVMRDELSGFEAASVQEIVKAANSVLDRVSEATAAKGAVGVEHRVGKDVTELLERVYGADGAGEGE